MARPDPSTRAGLASVVDLLLLATTTAAFWWLSYALGGAKVVPPHWYYLPILYAALRFGAWGATATALACTYVAGPLLPDLVATHRVQGLSQWLSRGGFFVAVGIVAAALFAHARRSLAAEHAQLEQERDTALAAVADRRTAERTTADRELALHRQAERQRFEGRVRRALEMAHDEHDSVEVLRRTVERGLEAVRGQLLLADASQAHLRQVWSIPSGQESAPSCSVTSPQGCPAVQSIRTQTFASSADFDACPRLVDADGARSAVCVPVTFMGQPLGVLHTTGPDRTPADADTVGRLEFLATQAALRLGTLRAFASSELQATTDGLTGLLNRRALEDRVRDLVAHGRRYTAVFCDLDRFKQLNDTHGHDAGDRALQAFARVLREVSRAGDLVSRYGGEEFLLVLPDAPPAAGERLAERARLALPSALAAAGLPGVTASFGVAGEHGGTDLATVVAAADAAMYEAKRAGRDCVRRAPEPAHPTDDPGRAAAPPAPADGPAASAFDARPLPVPVADGDAPAHDPRRASDAA